MKSKFWPDSWENKSAEILKIMVRKITVRGSTVSCLALLIYDTKVVLIDYY